MASNSHLFICIILSSLLLNIHVGNAQFHRYGKAKTASKITPKELQNMAKSNIIDNAINNLAFEMKPSNSTNSTECIKALTKLTESLTRAFPYIDASGKLRADISRGNLAWLGSFESCQDISDAHYCLLAFNIKIDEPQFKNQTIPLRWGICLPSVCGPVDLHNALANISKLHKFVKKVDITFKGASCPERPKYTTDVVITIVFCGFLLLLCLLGTIVDAFDCKTLSSSLNTNHDPGLQVQTNNIPDDEVPFQTSLQPYLHKSTDYMNAPLVSNPAKLPKNPGGFCTDFLCCFSLLRNTSKILSTEVPPKVITSINGIRVISMFWIILAHSFLFMLTSSLMENPVDMLQDARHISMMVIINGFFSVDSFFFLSGLLVAYTCFRKLEKSEGKFNWFLFYFHRYARLTPSLMFVILFQVKLRPFLVYSPVWTTRDEELCSKYWWTNLIYINNFYPTGFAQECLGWAWYLANDMQFYIISPLVLILAHRFGRFGLFGSAGSLLMISTITLASLYSYYDLDPMANSKYGEGGTIFNKAKADFSKIIYDKPYCRIQPYLIGMMLGYFMHKSYSGTRKPGWLLAMVGWLAAITVGLTLVYAPHDDVQKDGRHWTKAENVLYGMFSRVAWSLALAWVVYACHYGLGGVVQRFLSAKFWIPLSRLTYSAYLVHPILLLFMFTGSETTLHYSYANVSYNFIAAVVLAYACAFILAVVIEFPCDNLERLAINSLRKRKRANED